MKAVGLIIGVLVGLATLGAISVLGVSAVKYLSAFYLSLEPQTARLAVMATAVALICALIIAGALKTSARYAASAETAGLYGRLIAAWGERMKRPGAGREADAEFDELERLLALQANARVIAAHLALRRAAGEAGDEHHELLRKLAVEMRAELRGTREWLDKSQLLDLLLNRNSGKE